MDEAELKAAKEALTKERDVTEFSIKYTRLQREDEFMAGVPSLEQFMHNYIINHPDPDKLSNAERESCLRVLAAATEEGLLNKKASLADLWRLFKENDSLADCARLGNLFDNFVEKLKTVELQSNKGEGSRGEILSQIEGMKKRVFQDLDFVKPSPLIGDGNRVLHDIITSIADRLYKESFASEAEK